MKIWLAVAEPLDGKPASNGNDTMLGFNVGSAKEVDRLYEKSLQLGGTNEGKPGTRSGRYFKEILIYSYFSA